MDSVSDCNQSGVVWLSRNGKDIAMSVGEEYSKSVGEVVCG